MFSKKPDPNEIIVTTPLLKMFVADNPKKNGPIVGRLFQGYRTAWQKEKPPITDAYAKIDELRARDGAANKQITCRKGCSFCCAQRVGVTQPEAELLANEIKSGRVKVDKKRIAMQARWPDNPGEWSKRTFEHSRCTFLNDNNECIVYDVRPMSCRALVAVGPPRACGINVDNRKTKVQSYGVNIEIETLVAAVWTENKDTMGNLPRLLTEELKK